MNNNNNNNSNNNSNNRIKIKEEEEESVFKYLCKECEYNTIRESQYERHIKTKKHLNNKKEKIFKCDCGKYYKYASGLSKHKKTCETDLKNEKEKRCIYTKDDVEQFKDKIAGLEREKELLIENKILREKLSNKSVLNNSVTNITNNSNNNVSINNTFNLNFFLNDTCKDAMNINDFIDSIEVTVEDLKYLGKNGYVEGITKLIMDNLEQLDVTKRPLHCSDLKREIIHIKDNNVWDKEDKNREKIKRVLIDIKRSNTIALEKIYKVRYPQCMTDYSSKEHKEYGEIVYQNFGGDAKDIDFKNNKIIRRFLKFIEIEKESRIIK